MTVCQQSNEMDKSSSITCNFCAKILCLYGSRAKWRSLGMGDVAPISWIIDHYYIDFNNYTATFILSILKAYRKFT